MKQRIFSHFQDYLIQYISHQYQNLLYCKSSQYILSTYNSQHNNDHADCYAYLGLVLNDFLDYNITPKAVATSVNRALSLFIDRWCIYKII
jgi:hypothetical protein